MNCNYKVKIKDIQNKYQFKIFCKTYDDTEIQGDIETLNSDVEALQEENLYLNSLVEQAFDKKEVEGEELSINDTINAKMEVGLLGNTTQETTTGKQLFDKSNVNVLNAYIDNTNGNIGSDTNARAIYIPCKANTTYTVSKTVTPRFIVGLTSSIPANNVQCLSYIRNDSATSITIEGNANAQYLIVYLTNNYDSNTWNSILNNIMINEGSATPYEPYTGKKPAPNPDYPQEVHTVTGDNTIRIIGKQLFDETYPSINNNLSYKAIYVGEGNFTLKSNTPLNTSNNANLFFLAGNVTSGANTSINGVYAGTKRTQDSVNGYITIAYRNIDNVSPVDYRTILYKTSQEQTYQVNLGNIELNGIGDYKNFPFKAIDGDDYYDSLTTEAKALLEYGKWYKHSEIGKVVLDGTQPIGNINTSLENTVRITYLSIINGLSSVLLLCNRLQRLNMFNIDSEGIYYNATNGNLFFRMNKSTIGTTENAINTYLQSNNIIMYYPLATPTETEITDTTLIEQLEELNTAMSYAEQTNISQINDDIPFILKITALASYNSRIVALENAILNANRSTLVENTRKSNEVIEEPKEEVVDDNKDENIIKEEK